MNQIKCERDEFVVEFHFQYRRQKLGAGTPSAAFESIADKSWFDRKISEEAKVSACDS
jgi:hypothetical protein